jgi:WD40 repeat protein
VAATGADQFGDPPTVDVWRASDGLMVAKLVGLNFISNVVAFSPDGRYLAAGDWGGNSTPPKVLVWLAPAFTPVQSFSPYASSDGTIAFSPDSQAIAIVSSIGVGVTVYHLPDGLPLSVVPVNTGQSTWNLIFSDSNTLFGSGAQGLAGVWRVSDGTLLRSIGDERYFPGNSIAFSPDSAHLAVSNHATTSLPRVWQVEVLRTSDGASERLLASHGDIINSVAYSPDGTLVASACGSAPPDTQDTRIFISPVSGGAPLILSGHSGGTTSVAFSPDGTLLASGGRDNIVALWRVADGSNVRSMSGHANWISTVAFSPDGQSLASASGDSTVKLWRVSDGTLLRTIRGNGYPVGSAAFSPDGQMIALAANTSVQLWRVSDGTLLRTMNVEAGVNNLNHVVFSTDGSIVAVADGSYPPSIWLWRASDGATLKTYNGETGWVQPPALAFSPDGAMLGIGRYEGHVETARTPFTAAEVAAYTPAY